MTLIASGCQSAPRVDLAQARILGVRDLDSGQGYVIEIRTDQNIIALQADRHYAVDLLFNVDGAPPIRVGGRPYDPRQIGDRMPFGARPLQLVGSPPGEFVTHWGIPFTGEQNRDGTLFAYSLTDGHEHEVTIQLFGYKAPGIASWTSNELKLRFPARRQ